MHKVLAFSENAIPARRIIFTPFPKTPVPPFWGGEEEKNVAWGPPPKPSSIFELFKLGSRHKKKDGSFGREGVLISVEEKKTEKREQTLQSELWKSFLAK